MPTPEATPHIIDAKYREMLGGEATPDKIVSFLEGVFGYESVANWLTWRAEELDKVERESYQEYE